MSIIGSGTRVRGAAGRAMVLVAVLWGFSAAAAPIAVYTDALGTGWEDWSWATHSLTNTNPVHAGGYSISLVPSGWAALYLHLNGAVDGTLYDGLEFYVHGGSAGHQNLRIVFLSSGTVRANVPLSNYLSGGPPAGSWAAVRIPIDALGLGSGTFNELYFQDGSGGTQTTMYLDDIRITDRPGAGGPVTVAVSPELDRRAINPLIYGVSLMDHASSGSIAYPLRRWGGNWATTYNWQDDVRNVGMDWYWISYAHDTEACGSYADCFVEDSIGRGEAPLLTVPLIGSTPKDRTRRWSFSVAKYGAQQETECTRGDPSWCNPDAGNGVHTNGTNLTGNDPTDCYKTVAPSFVGSWVDHLITRFGTSATGGVPFYALDNEPMLWNSTHRDVHPAGVNYAEIWQRTQDYAAAIKAKDPNALIFGPVVWGWCAYFYSASDGCSAGADHNAHGDFLPWYLDQVKAYQTAHNVRLVDYLDIHYYPQANGVYSSDESGGTSALRLRTLKSLYDSTYSDESWIGQPVRLIPRMKEWLAAHAPDIKLAITEYNFGDSDSGISSALAQAEALAIFGREGVDAANRWVAPGANTLVEDAFKLYLNYDGAGSKIDGESVRCVSSKVDDIGAYAVRGSSGRLWILLFNKATDVRTAQVTVAGGLTGTLALYGFDASNRLRSYGTTPQTSGAFSLDLPARSVRLVLTTRCATPASVTGLRLAKMGTGGSLHLTWTDVSGATDYVITEDSSAGGAFATEAGTAASGTSGLTLVVPDGLRFFRAVARNACGYGPAT
jgi:hypothetical protein